jgi:hypothetical protein
VPDGIALVINAHQETTAESRIRPVRCNWLIEQYRTIRDCRVKFSSVKFSSVKITPVAIVRDERGGQLIVRV